MRHFAASLQNTSGIFAQSLAPGGAGTSNGLLRYMFWEAEAQIPATCEGGVGAGAAGYNLPIPMPPLRQQ